MQSRHNYVVDRVYAFGQTYEKWDSIVSGGTSCHLCKELRFSFWNELLNLTNREISKISEDTM